MMDDIVQATDNPPTQNISDVITQVEETDPDSETDDFTIVQPNNNKHSNNSNKIHLPSNSGKFLLPRP